MTNKLFVILGMIIILSSKVCAGFLNGYTIINEGLYVYTNTQWDEDILAKNNLHNQDDVKDHVIMSGNEVTYDFEVASSDQKIIILYSNMLKNAQETSKDLNTLIPNFIEDTNKIINEKYDYSLEALRDELLKNTSYTYNGVTYLIKNQKCLSFIDNIQNSVSHLNNGLYYINGIDKDKPKSYYKVYIVDSKLVVDCIDNVSGEKFNHDGYAISQDNFPKVIDEISESILGLYNIINNDKEYIESQKEKYRQDNQKANEYNSGANWLLDQSTATDMLSIEGTGGPGKVLESKTNANVRYDIHTINVPLSIKEGRGINSPYYNERNVEINNVNLKYTNLLEDHFNLCGGLYETDKEQSGDYEYNNSVEHIVFERNEKKAPTEVVIKTSNASYVIMNLKLNKKEYTNSQLVVYKDDILSQEITIDSPKKDVLIDVSDCNTIKFTVKPISKRIDTNTSKPQDNVVFEPGRYVKQGTYSKNYLESNSEASNFFEYNDMRLYADMYLVF